MRHTNLVEFDVGKRKFLFWFLQLVLWSSYFFYTLIFVHNHDYYSRNSIPSELILYLFFFCYMGIPLSMMLRYLYRYIRRVSDSLIVLLMVVIGGSIVMANMWFLEVVILDKISELFGHKITPYTIEYYAWEIFSASLLLFGWSAFYLLIKLWEEWNDQKTKTKTAILLAENAQLKMLRYQLNPHFFFNTLGSLRALIRQNPDKAVEMVSKISEFMRYSLISKPEDKVLLKDEIEAIRNYLEIEKVRFGDKIEIIYNIDKKALEFMVPGFILHPLIENAVKYGLETSPLPLVIEIRIVLEKNKLIMEVANSGSWDYAKDPEKGTGTGLHNVRNRLQVTYPNRYKLIIDKSNGKVRLIIEIGKNEV